MQSVIAPIWIYSVAHAGGQQSATDTTTNVPRAQPLAGMPAWQLASPSPLPPVKPTEESG